MSKAMDLVAEHRIRALHKSRPWLKEQQETSASDAKRLDHALEVGLLSLLNSERTWKCLGMACSSSFHLRQEPRSCICSRLVLKGCQVAREKKEVRRMCQGAALIQY